MSNLDHVNVVIQQLEATSKRKEKEAILNQAAADKNADFFRLAYLAYNPYMTFGIKKITASTVYQTSEATLEQFFQLAESFQYRMLTGHAGKKALGDFANSCSKTDWEIYRRVLTKDLRCGITETTINKVLEKHPSLSTHIIPTFECQLALDADNQHHKMTGVKIAQYKLDGIRVLAFIDVKNHNPQVTLYTRNGRENMNFPSIHETIINEIVPTMIKEDIKTLILDGEMVSTRFQELMKQVNRKEEVDTSDARFAIFDIITINDFKNGVSAMKQSDRLEFLSEMMENVQSPNCFEVKYEQFDLSTDQGINGYKQFFKTAIDLGFEGIMLKDPEALYECSRNANWLKIKPFITLDLEVIDAEIGTGKNANRLGALVCKGTHDGVDIVVKVGTGLSEEQRDQIWAKRDSIVGEIVEIEADAITKAENETHHSLRFPRFKRFRSLDLLTGKI